MQALTTTELLEAQALRVYLDRYQASHTLRIPPDDVNKLARINETLGYPPVNWWCATCVIEGLTRMYAAIDANHNSKPITISNNADTQT